MIAIQPEDRVQSTKAGRREWLGLAVIALPCLLYSMDLTVLNLAVPAISAELRPSATQLLWIVDIYGFMIAGALVTMGTLGDRIGRRRLLLWGAAAFGAASVLAAFSTSAEMLIVSRALLGLSAATLAPSTLSLIRNMFPDPAERTFAIGVWISSFSAGGAIGPLVGGVLLTWFWWGSVFLIAVPVMLLLLAVGPKLLPEYRDPEAGKMDIPSAALSLAAVLAIIWAIKRFAEDGITLQALAVLSAGVLLAAMFLRRQRRLSEPLVDLALFRAPAFGAALAVNVIGFFAAFGTFLLVAQYLQLVLGLTPFQAGLVSAPSSLGFIAGSMLAPRLLRVMRPAHVMAAGYAVAAIGFLILARAETDYPIPLILAGFSVLSLGLAPVFTLATDLIVGSAPPEKAGTAAGLAETSSEFGGALGIAILGAVVMALYRTTLGDELPAGLPAEIVAAARDTVGTALDEASRLGGSTGEAVAAAARRAYTVSFEIAATICAFVSALAALAAAVLLRKAGGADGDSSASCEEPATG